MHAYIHTYMWIHALQIDIDLDFLGFFLFSVEGQSDGSGEEDISPMGNASDCGLCRFTDQRGASEGSLQQEIDYPSTNLWSNSSRCTAHLSLFVCVWKLRELYAHCPRTLLNMMESCVLLSFFFCMVP